MGLFDHFPYTNVHELNLDWVLSMMKALEAEWEAFTAGNSLTFADPMLHDISKSYAKNTIVLDGNGNAYVSLQAVPVGVGLQDGDYWLMVFDYEAFIEKVNKNFTARYYRGSYRATTAMAIGDWLTVDDVLYKATAAIAADDALEVGVNIEPFTLEDFIKAFMQSANQLIQQYKNDIDASEVQYRNLLAQDIADTTATLQAQLNAAISGVTVDSEVIDARVGYDSTTYPTLGDAIRTQVGDIWANLGQGFKATSVPANTDLDTFKDIGVWYCSGNQGYSNYPYNAAHSAWLIITRVNNIYQQLLIPYFMSDSAPGLNNEVVRRNFASGSWSNWKSIEYKTDGRLDTLEATAFTTNGVLANNTDLNDVKSQGYWYLSSSNTYSNFPYDSAYNVWLVVFKSGSIVQQLAIPYFMSDNAPALNLPILRRNWSGSTWSNWKLLENTLFSEKGVLATNTDLDDVKSQGYWYMSSSNTYSNSPYSASYNIWLYVYTSGNIVEQITIPYFMSDSAPSLKLKPMRRNYASGSWSNWKPLIGNDNYGEYYAFGDSLTLGSVNVSHTKPDVVYPELVAESNNLILHNLAVGGQGLIINQGASDYAYDTVSSTDISSAKLITLAWGTNDTAGSLGSPSDASGASTVCGQMKAILDYIFTNNPTCEVIIIGMPRSSLDFDEDGAGGWSRDDFITAMQTIGSEYCVPVISYRDCSICNATSWDAVTSASDRVHPTNAGYYITSAYLAGQISKYFSSN